MTTPAPRLKMTLPFGYRPRPEPPPWPPSLSTLPALSDPDAPTLPLSDVAPPPCPAAIPPFAVPAPAAWPADVALPRPPAVDEAEPFVTVDDVVPVALGVVVAGAAVVLRPFGCALPRAAAETRLPVVIPAAVNAVRFAPAQWATADTKAPWFVIESVPANVVLFTVVVQPAWQAANPGIDVTVVRPVNGLNAPVANVWPATVMVQLSPDQDSGPVTPPSVIVPGGVPEPNWSDNSDACAVRVDTAAPSTASATTRSAARANRFMTRITS